MMHPLIFVRIWLFVVSVAIAPAAGAVYLNSLVYEMQPDEKFISLPVTNDTTRTNLYTLDVFEISKPTVATHSRLEGAGMQVVFSPLRFTVEPEGRDFFKLYYQGPEDSVERYYRIVIKESSIKLFPFNDKNKNSDVNSVLSMSFFLIVRPRIHKFAYEVNESAGIIKNTGNTFFRVVIQNGCNGNDNSSKQLYMLPGELYSSSLVSTKNKKFIVAMGRYTTLGEGCFKA